MKPAPFAYIRAASIDDAVEALQRYGDEAKLLAGGQVLVPLMNLRLARPAYVIDINGLTDLANVREVDGGVFIGSLTRLRDVGFSPIIRRGWPLLTEASVCVGDLQVRNRATIGGNVCHGDPRSQLAAALSVLDGQFRLRSVRGERLVTWSDFYVGHLTTCLDPEELLIEIRLLPLVNGTGWGFLEFRPAKGAWPLVVVAALLTLDRRRRCTDARIGLSGVTGKPIRASLAERVLIGETPGEEAFKVAAKAAAQQVQPNWDIHGTSEYKKALVEVLTARALVRAAESTKVAE